MNIYKIYNSVKSYIKKFASLEDATIFAESLGSGYSVEYVGPYTPPSSDEQRQLDTDFCTFLTNRFLDENRDAGITEPESIALLAQFKDILSMAQVGSVPSVYSLLQNVTVGTIYTQERKTRDLADLESYINNV